MSESKFDAIEIAEAILRGEFSEEDIATIHHAIGLRGRNQRALANVRAITKVRVGMRVAFGDKTAQGKRGYMEGEVVEIKRSRVIIRVDGKT